MIGLLVTSFLAHADGLAFRSNDLSAFDPVAPHEQVAAIALHDGMQDLFIRLDVDLAQTEGLLWVFPVPGHLDAVSVDIADGFPVLGGTAPRWKARATVMDAIALTQVPTLIGCFCLTLSGEGLEIPAAVERHGVRAELVATTSQTALQDYLEARRSSIPEDAASYFAPYLDGEHTLVVAWVTSLAELGAAAAELQPGVYRSPALHVRFPTDRPFYPMQATAGYADARVPVRLYVEGWVEPRTEMPVYIEHTAFRGQLARDAAPPAMTAALERSEGRYTRVRFADRASAYTDDLTFEPHPPGHLAMYEAIVAATDRRFGFLGLVAVLGVLQAAFASLLGSLALFHRPRWWSLLGLTILGTPVLLGVAINVFPGRTNRDQRLAFFTVVLLGYVLCGIALRFAAMLLL